MDMLVRKHPMPEIAAFVAELRDAFGEAVDEAIARGKAGRPGFYARGERQNNRNEAGGPLQPLGGR